MKFERITLNPIRIKKNCKFVIAFKSLPGAIERTDYTLDYVYIKHEYYRKEI